MSALEQLAGRRILFLNWRDLANPAAGGAESYTEHIARRLSQAGSAVTLFTSAYRDAPPHDWSNGYLVIRKGGRFGVYLAAGRHLRHNHDAYDAVIDFSNGIPFFAPFWVPPKMPVICVMHHVHQRQFDMYFGWPMNHVGRLLEGRVSRRVYGTRPMVAVSPSTRTEMRRELGFRGVIHIVPNGIEVPRRTVPRSPTPTIALVTRLVPHKRIDHLVDAVPALLRRWPDLRVVIGGAGASRDALQEQVRRLGLEKAVSLPGRVSEEVKTDLLASSWLTVAPSLSEGWGAVVIEANSVGTPAVAYDVPGLRDSIRHGITGWLVQPGETLAVALSQALADLSNPARRGQLSGQARSWAARFSWDSTAERMAGVLLTEITRREQGGAERRQPIDLATIAVWPRSMSDEVAPILRKVLRATDIVTVDDEGLKALLMGCDEFAAAKALQRVPVPPTALRLATNTCVMSTNAAQASLPSLAAGASLYES